jgi:hypothetical protein
MKIETTERSIIGHWIFENGVMVKDQACERVEWLIANYLNMVATDNFSWDALYVDPSDNRFWELRFLQSEMHGGGPPSLFNISKEEVEIKYPQI